jgi:starch synthase (maltosyl-transferring)
VLAATLGASYGIYSGFGLWRLARQAAARYHDSGSIKSRRAISVRPTLAQLIGRINAIRREHRALQFDWGLEFLETDNPNLICYAKRASDGADPILVVVNLDPVNMQHGHVRLPLAEWTQPLDSAVEAHDLLSDEIYVWRGDWNYVRLDPQTRVAHIIRLRTDASAGQVSA